MQRVWRHGSESKHQQAEVERQATAWHAVGGDAEEVGLLSISGGRPTSAASTAMQRNADVQRVTQGSAARHVQVMATRSPAWHTQPLHRKAQAKLRWSKVSWTLDTSPVSALHWPFSGKCYAKPTLVRWRFESIPDLELRRAPLSLALVCAPFPLSLSPPRTAAHPSVDCFSPPSAVRVVVTGRPSPQEAASCLFLPEQPPLHYAPQLRPHTSFAATSTPDRRQNHRALRTPSPGSSTTTARTRACPR